MEVRFGKKQILMSSLSKQLRGAETGALYYSEGVVRNRTNWFFVCELTCKKKLRSFMRLVN